MKEYRDYYFRKAKNENYPARSVYKLKELDSKFGLLKRGMKVLDLGAAPGSWTLGALEKIGETGKLIACDLKNIEIPTPPAAEFFQEDIFNPSGEFILKLKEAGPFDLVMSDMAPATTGSRFTDQARSMELFLRALEIAREHLGIGGSFVAKVFMGPDVRDALDVMRRVFKTVKTHKPKSSRPESKETFLAGLGYKGETDDGKN
ncbi:MAG: RlmE family RNA methyltransferase [Desulfovibrio sp.]|nr:RlmE family RNA methyltransferase [Desulfovibrio sp.]